MNKVRLGGRLLDIFSFAVLEHRLHGALAVGGPADAGRASDLVLNGPPALPEVHLMVIVN